MLLSPLLDIQEQDVHISDKHTHLLNAPDPLHPSPSEGSGKIPGECWALAWIQGFTALWDHFTHEAEKTNSSWHQDPTPTARAQAAQPDAS